MDIPRVEARRKRGALVSVGLLLGALAGLLVGRAWSTAVGHAVAGGERGDGEESSVRTGDGGPRFTEDGALLRPQGVERWLLAGASLGLGYGDSPEGPAGGPGRFHNVYLEPGAYATFRRTGTFPQGTMLAMAVYEPEERIPPQRQGYVEGALTGLEVAVKDSTRFEGGWAYFGFAGDGGPAGDTTGLAQTARPFPPSACFACHRAHGARDNVFTQFYPLLRGAARP